MDDASRAEVHAQMVRFARGHRDAFDAVYAALWPQLRAFTARLLPDPTEAEDAAQNALCKVFSRITDFDTRRDGLAWALSITAYEVRTLRKQHLRRRAQGSSASADAPHEQEAPDDALIAHELRRALKQALAHLSEADREALLSVEDAQPAGPMPPHMRKRRQRAMERLRNFWRRLHGPY